MQENSQDHGQDNGQYHGQADAPPRLLDADGVHWRQAGMVLLAGHAVLTVTTARFNGAPSCAVSLGLNDGAAMDMCLRLDLHQARALLRVLGQAVRCAEDVDMAIAMAQGVQP